MTECPDCGGEFQGKNGLLAHYGQVHGGSPLEKPTFKCDYCGKVNERTQSQMKDLNFCDWECKCAWQSECKPTEEHNWYSGGPVTVECSECGDPIEKKPSMAERAENYFCSSECESEWKTGRHLGVNKDRSEIRHSETYYGPNWEEQRRKRLEHDGYECVVCSISNEEHKIRYGTSLHVHHIQPKEAFRISESRVDYSAANRMENLISLCQACHKRWEGVPLRPEVNHE